MGMRTVLRAVTWTTTMTVRMAAQESMTVLVTVMGRVVWRRLLRLQLAKCQQAAMQLAWSGAHPQQQHQSPAWAMTAVAAAAKPGCFQPQTMKDRKCRSSRRNLWREQ
jgi:hypothetical protein